MKRNVGRPRGGSSPEAVREYWRQAKQKKRSGEKEAAD